MSPTPAAARVWGAAATLAAPALRLMLALRLRRGKEAPGRLAERRGFGGAPRPPGSLIWLHAASVGEAVSAWPVLQALPASIHVLFTTGTVTSAQLLAERLPALGLADRVTHRFVPLDVPAWAARFLDHWHPDAACFLESELWPNLLGACQARGIPMALVNARMSARSAAAWARAPALAKACLGGFAFIAARSREDGARLTALGAPEPALIGDLKGSSPALPFDEAERARLAKLLGDRPRLLAASTHAGEEALVARVHQALVGAFPELIIAIVPRHPERGAALAAALEAGRRSLVDDPPGDGGLWLADTLGELGLLYATFPIVIMGKSFPPQEGGQNPLEPARAGCRIAIGPAHGNFAGPVLSLERAGALTIVEDEAALIRWARAMLRDPNARLAAFQPEDRTLPEQIASRLAALAARP